MRVAVVIPVHNGVDTIERTVRAVLDQTRPADDVVVVDNASTDGTATAARAAGARVITEATPGSYAARNAGIRAVTAEVIAFTDADCVPDRHWLERLVARFDEDETIDVVGGEIEATEVRTATERWCAQRGMLSQAGAYGHPFRPCFATANVAWRTSALDRIGGFEAALRSGGDVDAHWRLHRLGGRIEFAPEAIVRHPHRPDVRALLAQQRSYGLGHGRLDGRWSIDPRYRDTAGTVTQRLRALWLLPFRLPWRVLTRKDPAIPVIDALVRAARELGRWRGRRLPPLPPLPPVPSSVDPLREPADRPTAP